MGAQVAYSSDTGETHNLNEFQKVVDGICGLRWEAIDAESLTYVAWAYYYFSIQFRENLEVARKLFPEDELLLELDHGERDTDNLSPWPGVAAPGEKMNHDEFMRRTLTLSPIAEAKKRELEALGAAYLSEARSMDDTTRALSIASYEDGGLEAVFTAFLSAKNWDGPLLGAFKHFLAEHIRFDSDPDAGHGALCRHLTPDDRILPLWKSFYELLTSSAPALVAQRLQ
jgi:hypothetical protein